MRIAMIFMISAMLVLAACGPSGPQPVEPKMPAKTVGTVEKMPAQEPVVAEPEAQGSGLEDIDSSLQEADTLADELDFAELDALDEELKELENMDFE